MASASRGRVLGQCCVRRRPPRLPHLGSSKGRGGHGVDWGASPYTGIHIYLPNGGILEAPSTASAATGVASRTGWRHGQDCPESNNPVTLRLESRSEEHTSELQSRQYL